MHVRRLGWKPDRAKLAGGKPDRDAAGWLGSDPVPHAATCRERVRVLDQGGLGSCTAQAVTQALRNAMLRQGAPASIEFGSRLWLYYLARLFDNDVANDNGAFLRNVLAGAVKYGVPAERYWAYDDASTPGAKFARMPSFEAFKMAADQRAPTDYSRIASYGARRIEDVKRAIAQGHLVVFGTDVSDDFCLDRGTDRPVDPPVGKSIAGGHAMAWAEYEGDVFRGPNSWSEGWGQAGWFEMTADYVAWEGTRDLWIVRYAAIFSEEEKRGQGKAKATRRR